MAVQQEHFLPKTEKLGEILVRRDLLSRERLKEALKIQKRDKGYLGETLVRLGYVDERDIVVALVVQCNLPYIAVDKYDIKADILDLIPGDIARKYLIVPLDRVGDVLSLVMADPLNVNARRELQSLTHCRIAPFIGLRGEIEGALNRWYGGE